MERFDLNILGCGSATPTMQHNPSAQVLNIREKLFMIDCGEGTQLQFRHSRLRFGRLNHIFISHLHGDHCFGLIGLISTLALLGRTGDIVIHAHADLELILRPQLDYFCREIPCDVKIEPFDPQKVS
jgi:ribonuclease Z